MAESQDLLYLRSKSSNLEAAVVRQQAKIDHLRELLKRADLMVARLLDYDTDQSLALQVQQLCEAIAAELEGEDHVTVS